MYFSPVEFLVLICFISCLLTTFLCWFFFTVIIFIKLCKASWQVWVKRHLTLFFESLQAGLFLLTSLSLSPWQQICPPGSGNLWAVLSLWGGMPGQSRLPGSWGLLPTVTGRAYSALHGTNKAVRKKVFSPPFREDDKPQPKDEPCIRQMKELKRKATRWAVLLLTCRMSGRRSEKFWLVFEILRCSELSGRGILLCQITPIQIHSFGKC